MFHWIQQWMTRRRLRQLVANSNLQMANALLVKNFTGKVIPNELARLLDEFGKNPSIQTALELINYDPNFVSFFVLSRKGAFSESLFDHQ